MKIQGEKLEGPNIEILVLPRGEKSIIFKARAVLEMTDFEKICPPPEAPIKLLKGGKRVPNIEDPTHKQAIRQWSEKKIAWMVLKSLDVTEGLEWETVNIEDQNTWLGYVIELRKVFSEAEIGRILDTVLTANGLNEQRLTEARDYFLALQAELATQSSSPGDGQLPTQFGLVANG